MTRALSLTCLAFLAAGLASSTASAGNKPTIAVLGLETSDAGRAPTPVDTNFAKELTDGLRSRTKLGTGMYVYAPGSDKELIDLKLINSCDSEAAGCMSKIGESLGADLLIYGKIEKKGRSYEVTLILLDVRKKAREKSLPSEAIPLADATSSAAISAAAKRLYAKLTGETSSCNIAVKVSGGAERGTILIDGAERGSINNGSGQVTGLTEGKYKVAVEIEGYRRWERADVTCAAGQTANVPVDNLEKVESGGGGLGSGSGSGRGSGVPISPEATTSHGDGSGWKKIAFGSAVVTSGLTAVWATYWYKLSKTGGDYPGYGDSCKQDPVTHVHLNIWSSDCNSGRKNKDISWTAGIGAAAVGAFTIYALVKGYSASNSGAEHADAGHRKRREQFVVTPVISPNGGGATLQFDW
jgi:hypothetical protein